MNESIESILNSIVSFLNSNYNQDSEDYCVFRGARPQVVKYGEHAAISFWGCGAIVCIYDQLHFISEDDGYWWVTNGLRIDDDRIKDGDNITYRSYDVLSGFQTGFSIAWAEGFADALKSLNEYVKNNGEPVYFSGLTEKVVCHYTL